MEKRPEQFCCTAVQHVMLDAIVSQSDTNGDARRTPHGNAWHDRATSRVAPHDVELANPMPNVLAGCSPACRARRDLPMRSRHWRRRCPQRRVAPAFHDVMRPWSDLLMIASREERFAPPGSASISRMSCAARGRGNAAADCRMLACASGRSAAGRRPRRRRFGAPGPDDHEPVEQRREIHARGGRITLRVARCNRSRSKRRRALPGSKRFVPISPFSTSACRA